MSKSTFLVTGCSSGIGLAITRELIEKNCQVYGVARHAPDLSHPDFHFLQADLMESEDRDRLAKNLGQIDGFIHAAGQMKASALNQLKLEDGHMMWQLHLQAAAHICALLSDKINQNGRIILIGSRVADGKASRSLYAASKAGLVGFSRSIASELAFRGITVNIVAPGATDTPMLGDPKRASSAPQIPPFGRFIKPTEIAAMVLFLLSPASASITGQHIVICGGASL